MTESSAMPPAWGRGLRWILLALCAVYAVSALGVYPSLMPDPSYGLLVHKSMRAGGAWNHMIEPREDNIALDQEYFYATWSPGQYLAPGLLMDAGLAAGPAVAVVSVTASLVGLLLWFWLFRVLQFSSQSAVAACVLIAASRSFNYSFVAYVGSDVLAFALFPLLAGLAVRLKYSRWAPVFAALATIAAFTAKNSLPIYFGAWVTGLSLQRWRESGWRARDLPFVLAPSAAVAVMLALIHAAYTSRGWSPLVYEPRASTALSSYLVPWAMPILAATSWDDVLSRLFSHPSAPALAFDYRHSVWFVAAVAAASTAAAFTAARRDTSGIGVVCALFSAIVAMAFTVLLTSGSAASLDLSRHYRLVGYVWLPFIAAAALPPRRPVRAVVAALLILPCVYGLGSYGANWRRHWQQKESHSASLQITHPQLSPRLVRLLHTIDQQAPAGATLVVTPTPMYALEFTRSRVLATSAVSDSVERIESVRRYGMVPNLVVIAELPAMSDTMRDAWLASFTSVRKWESLDVDNHRFYTPAGQTVSPAWLQARVTP